MSGLVLAATLILIPIVGMLFSLFLSKLEPSISNDGKTQDWILFIIIFLPIAIISFILLGNIHQLASYSITWLPGIVIGLRINEVSIAFACVVANLGALLALYSISYMEYDRNRSRYWFFYLLTMASMMMAIFSNNLFWLFGGIEVASIGAFFLISHWHKKTGAEGEKAGKAAIRYLIMSIVADIFILMSFSFILAAYNTSILNEIFVAWGSDPIKVLAGTSSNTRTLIRIFLVIGALIKSAQLPILLWPLSGDKKDSDFAKAPLPISSYLLSVTIGNIGLFLLCAFNPIFTSGGNEAEISIPFILIGWIAIITLFVVIGMLFSTKNINRITIGASIAQLSFSFLAFSAGNELGYAASIFHMITGAPTTIALTMVFGLVIESIRIKDVSRIGGYKDRYPLLQMFGVLAVLGFSGIFPSSVYFSKDMIFESLRLSSIPSSMVLMILGLICSLLLIVAITKIFMQIFYGQFDDQYTTRETKKISIVTTSTALGWTIFAGILSILIGYPNPRIVNGLLNRVYPLNYASPLFSNWVQSPITIILTLAAFVTTYYLYRDGVGSALTKLKETKLIQGLQKFFANGLYLDNVYELITYQPISYLSKFFAWTRIRAPFASIIWAILSVVLLVSILALVGGIT